MRIIIHLIFVLVLTACDQKIESHERKLADIENICNIIESGNEISNASSLFSKSRHRTKMTKSDESGYIIFWNGPNIKVISKDVMKGIIPHGQICKVAFNTNEKITKITSKFISEAEYQAIKKNVQPNK